jgi:predicted anti-sigma-YlaC factor YlaD
MMSCHEVNGFLEAVAVGEPVPDDVRAHVDDCPSCRARLRLAERIERTLASRPVLSPSASFTTALVARVRRERWRAEQMLDWGFNIFVAVGVGLIVTGVAGLVWASGLVAVSPDAFRVISAATDTALAGVASQARTFTLAALLLTLTLGVWWWIEGDLTT